MLLPVAIHVQLVGTLGKEREWVVGEFAWAKKRGGGLWTQPTRTYTRDGGFLGVRVEFLRPDNTQESQGRG